MEVIIRFISTIIMLIIIESPNIESTPNFLLRLSSLCPPNEYTSRLVRTPYGLRCLDTKRLTKKPINLLNSLLKRSPQHTENLSPLESQFRDLYEDKNPILDQESNSVTPSIKSVPTTKYKKVVIKNNRGPWKIANQIFERSPHRRRPPVGVNNEEELAEYQLTSRTPRTTKRIVIRNSKSLPDRERDGLMVNQKIVYESVGKVPQLVVGSWMKVPEPGDESQEMLPISSSSVINKKITTKTPLKNMSAIPAKSYTKFHVMNNMKPKHLKSLKFKSDIEVIDLLQEDSVINSSFRRNNSIKLADDRRRTRSPLDVNSTPLSLTEISNQTKMTPIKIYVFLNRNRTFDSITEPSEKYEIGERLRRPSQTTTEPTTTSTTTTTIPPLTIRKVLKKLDFVEVEERVGSDEEDGDEGNADGGNADEESYSQFSLTTSIPISRNWNFVCGQKRGFFADVDNDCRSYYQCSVRGRQRFECPPGTRFNQDSSICDWLENVNCLQFKDKSFTNDNNEKLAEDHIENSSEAPTRFTTSTSSAEPDEYEDSIAEE